MLFSDAILQHRLCDSCSNTKNGSVLNQEIYGRQSVHMREGKGVPRAGTLYDRQCVVGATDGTDNTTTARAAPALAPAGENTATEDQQCNAICIQDSSPNKQALQCDELAW